MLDSRALKRTNVKMMGNGSGAAGSNPRISSRKIWTSRCVSMNLMGLAPKEVLIEELHAKHDFVLRMLHVLDQSNLPARNQGHVL